MTAVQRSGVFGNVNLSYVATVGEVLIRDEVDRPAACMVFTSYCVVTSGDVPERPVIFAFNGGPGSSSVWLHLGLLGPRRVTDADTLRPRTAPPFSLKDNQDSPLDVADVVLIDPPGTGFSRILGEEQESNLLGPVPDAVATIKFISEWARRNGRENAPKFLLGESYGGIRAALVARMSAGGPTNTGSLEALSLNGVLLMGTTLSDLDLSEEIELVTALPSLAATAWFHERVTPRPNGLEEHVEAARAFASNEYLTALFCGTTLDAEARSTIALRLHRLTGITPEVWMTHDLRMTTKTFAQALLADIGDQVGLFDGRYVLPLAGAGTDDVVDDPAMGQYLSAFAGSISRYLRDELEVDRDEDYRAIEFARINQRWSHISDSDEPQGANYAHDLAAAMRRNPQLELLVCAGHYDLATTAGAASYWLTRAPLDKGRVHMRTYESGHMPYLGQRTRECLASDIREFVTRVCASANQAS